MESEWLPLGPPKRPTGASAAHPSFPGTSTSSLKNQNGLRNTILPHSSPCWLPPHAYFMIPAYSLHILHPARHPSAAWSISAWQMFPRRHVLELQDLLGGSTFPSRHSHWVCVLLKYRGHTLYSPRLVCKTKDRDGQGTGRPKRILLNTSMKKIKVTLTYFLDKGY